MTSQIAFIAVGSNIQPLANIPRALQLLSQRVNVIASSTFYQTQPLGPPRQFPFVNGVWCVATRETARHVKKDCLAPIETQMGRVRTEDPYAPRVIDLDLILYGHERCERPDLKLPHPDLERPFVSGPIWELVELLNLPLPFQNNLPPRPARNTIGIPHSPLTHRLRQSLV